MPCNGTVDMAVFYCIEGTEAASRLGKKGAEVKHRLKQAGKPQMVDPTTSEIIYSADEVEFMNAVQAYKQQTGRKFPAYSELLRVLKGLGYQKVV